MRKKVCKLRSLIITVDRDNKDSMFIWFDWYWRNKQRTLGIGFDYGPPVWWLPKVKLMKVARGIRIGWLLWAFSIGGAPHPQYRRNKGGAE